MDTNGNYIQNQFCSYEIAVKLKELGFDEPCIAYYAGETLLSEFVLDYSRNVVYTQADNDYEISAPLWQQVIDWGRTKYNYDITLYSVLYSKETKTAYFYTIISNKTHEVLSDYNQLYDEVLESSYQDLEGDYINDDLYDKNIFDMGFAYKTYEEAREQAILKAIELCQNKKS